MGRRRKKEPVKTKTDRHGIRRRLLEAGAAEFAAKGIQGTKVALVAKEAGVSVGAFYRYFRDKDELYRDIVQARFDFYLSEIGALLSDLDGLNIEQRVDLIRRVFRRSFEIHLEDPQTFLLWYRHGYGGGDEITEVVATFARDVEALLVEVFGSMLTLGDALPVEERSALATVMLGIANTMTHRLIVDGTPSVETAVDVCTRLMTTGLAGFVSVRL